MLRLLCHVCFSTIILIEILLILRNTNIILREYYSNYLTEHSPVYNYLLYKRKIILPQNKAKHNKIDILLTYLSETLIWKSFMFRLITFYQLIQYLIRFIRWNNYCLITANINLIELYVWNELVQPINEKPTIALNYCYANLIDKVGFENLNK